MKHPLNILNMDIVTRVRDLGTSFAFTIPKNDCKKFNIDLENCLVFLCTKLDLKSKEQFKELPFVAKADKNNKRFIIPHLIVELLGFQKDDYIALRVTDQITSSMNKIGE